MYIVFVAKAWPLNNITRMSCMFQVKISIQVKSF